MIKAFRLLLVVWTPSHSSCIGCVVDDCNWLASVDFETTSDCSDDGCGEGEKSDKGHFSPVEGKGYDLMI